MTTDGRNSCCMPRCMMRFLVMILVCLFSLIILWSFSFGIYYMITFNSRKHCMVCEEFEDGEYSWFAPFFWYSDWALITCTSTWFVWVWQQLADNKNATSEKGNSSSLFLIELSLPLSLFAMIGYTVYLGTSDWGNDLVDKEACHTLADSATPKEGTEEEDPSTSAKMYLVSAVLTGFSMHYMCPTLMVVLYFKYYVRKAPWNPLRPIGFVVFLSLAVILAQEVGGAIIYCTSNIYMTALYAILFCTVVHAIFFFRPSGGGSEEELSTWRMHSRENFTTRASDDDGLVDQCVH